MILLFRFILNVGIGNYHTKKQKTMMRLTIVFVSNKLLDALKMAETLQRTCTLGNNSPFFANLLVRLQARSPFSYYFLPLRARVATKLSSCKSQKTAGSNLDTQIHRQRTILAGQSL